jgi:hypothetical protein
MAGKIARDAGLADQSGFCPVDPESMKSKIDANIFVVDSRRHAQVDFCGERPG